MKLQKIWGGRARVLTYLREALSSTKIHRETIGLPVYFYAG